MNTILCLIGFVTLSIIPGSLCSIDHQQLRITPADIFGAAYTDGYRQILAANLSPKCKEKALKDLAAAHQAEAAMPCTGFVENLEDIGTIVDTAVNSVGSLIDDLNTVFNAVPLCLNSKSGISYIIGLFSCTFGQASILYTALKDFWNYKDYVMDTVNVIEDYVNCLENNKKSVSKNVQVIVETAKFCR
ncbi:hypothetical protein GE061_010418 [Apolygus lucorum]|uniref:Protein TsetseEP domain-containing protein n=1 Tax=Apolygus lucorum TaxID=248454 RepID=A0A8S9Y2Z0_APOLU|nr:hypothetical protein GE061_010418 [Apolygus lucorum]